MNTNEQRDAEIKEMAIIVKPDGDKDKFLLRVIGRLWDGGVRYIDRAAGEFIATPLSGPADDDYEVRLKG